MKALLGQLVCVRDATGAMTQGILDRFEFADDGLWYYVLTKSEQVNYVNVPERWYESWYVEGENWIAKHACVGVHLSHLKSYARH